MTASRLEILQEFGLATQAARAYLALLAMGDCEAREVSRVAKIPLAKVYQVLEGLQQRGLCEIMVGSPKRFSPVPFGAFLDRVRREHERSIEAIERRRKDLEGALVIAGGARLSDRGRVQVVTGRAGVLELEARLFDRASVSILMVCTPGRLHRMRKVFSLFERAAERGVEIRILAPASSPTWDVDAAHFRRVGEVRPRSHDEHERSETVAFVIVDRSHAVLIDAIPDDADLLRGNDVATHITELGIVSALADAFTSLWDAAPLRARGDPPERPDHSFTAG